MAKPVMNSFEPRVGAFVIDTRPAPRPIERHLAILLLRLEAAKIEDLEYFTPGFCSRYYQEEIAQMLAANPELAKLMPEQKP